VSEAIDISSESLGALRAAQPERDVLLLDVRQPKEYLAGHIPGALSAPLIPLLDGEVPLEPTLHVVCYCATGHRSRLAAVNLARRLEAQVYNLVGGIVAWRGGVVRDAPRATALDAAAGAVSDLLRRAIALEKGAHVLYTAMGPFFAGPARDALDGLAAAEIRHARLLHRVLRRSTRAQTSFEDDLARAGGTTLESGAPLSEALEGAGAGRVGLLELAVAMELGAHDLYRHLARRLEAADLRRALLYLAAEERGHAETLLDLLERESGA